ncbi:MAG: hypothetical protein U0793_30990 [Gemmataceae bacterium]
MTLICLAASLFPLALYLFFLAGLNRRHHPVLLHGFWEALGLLFALSGFFLVTGPALLNELYARELLAVPIERDSEAPFEEILFKWRVLWLIYFVAVVVLAGTLIVSRMRRRGVYNVDMEGFRAGLARTLEELALSSRAEGSTVFLYPLSLGTRQGLTPETSEGVFVGAPDPRQGDEPTSADVPQATLTFDAFPTLAHIALEWLEGDPAFRAVFEQKLMANLKNAVALDNPAAGWFIGVASMISGALLMLLAFILFGHLLPRR